MPFGEGSPVGRQLATTPAALAGAFGIDTFEAAPKTKDIQSAVSKARKNGKPSLIQVELESPT